jgi:hypothetical protein
VRSRGRGESACVCPSEVLVSQTVKDLVAGPRLAFEDMFEDRGAHELKGVPEGRRPPRRGWRNGRLAAEHLHDAVSIQRYGDGPPETDRVVLKRLNGLFSLAPRTRKPGGRVPQRPRGTWLLDAGGTRMICE